MNSAFACASCSSSSSSSPATRALAAEGVVRVVVIHYFCLLREATGVLYLTLFKSERKREEKSESQEGKGSEGQTEREGTATTAYESCPRLLCVFWISLSSVTERAGVL